MPRGKKPTAEQIIGKLREGDLAVSKGSTAEETAKAIGVTAATCFRWREEYTMPKRSLADVELDKAIVKDAASGNLLARRNDFAIWVDWHLGELVIGFGDFHRLDLLLRWPVNRQQRDGTVDSIGDQGMTPIYRDRDSRRLSAHLHLTHCLERTGSEVQDVNHCVRCKSLFGFSIQLEQIADQRHFTSGRDGDIRRRANDGVGEPGDMLNLRWELGKINDRSRIWIGPVVPPPSRYGRAVAYSPSWLDKKKDSDGRPPNLTGKAIGWRSCVMPAT